MFPLEFKSKRFRMRLLRRADYARWKSAYMHMLPRQNEFDEEAKKSKELGRAEYFTFLKRSEGFRKSGAIYHFGIFEKKTGRLMGFVMISLVLRFNVQSARISYHIFNNYWKHGYATEAVDAAIDYGLRKMKLHRLEAEIEPHNSASVAVARKVGMQFEGLRRKAVYFRGTWHDHAVYAVVAEDRGIRKSKPKIFK